MDYIDGVDLSRYDGKVDWAKMKAKNVQFVTCRATVGDYYTDPTFFENMKNAIAAGIRVSAYHVVVPNISAKSQINRFISEIGGLRLDDEPVLDVELVRDCSRETITGVTMECGHLLMGYAGFAYPMIYTAQGFWNSNVISSAEWEKFPLWVANYTMAPSPLMPRDWKKWHRWQWSADGNGRGPEFGVTAASIDLNREMVEPHYPPFDAKDTFVLREGIRIRQSPTVNSAEVGHLTRGLTVVVFDEYRDGDDIWVALNKERTMWSAFQYNGEPWMKYSP